MPWDTTFHGDIKVLQVTSHGIMSVATVKQMCVEIIEAGRHRGALGYLIDHRDMTPNLTTVDISSYPQFLADMGTRRSVKIAYVFSQSAKKDDVDYFETVMSNHGFKCQFFSDLSTARLWLQEVE